MPFRSASASGQDRGRAVNPSGALRLGRAEIGWVRPAIAGSLLALLWILHEDHSLRAG
jgi:hypothetical protein